ncbi:ATP-binding protein [Pontibacterium granulatum]|uniref:sensor histidine kinase n=1 Tax=Pontibacterium granulatum TaxID=2036029 RepID=UPI00249A0B81|nr:ATP-binding protein [Pontibacterium granulatum]MDI3324571.1 ATP-binding protein [Pontibacterium granulatum]
MRWYKRLFVKIFLAIWLASSIVLLATIAIVGGVSERSNFRNLVVATAQGHAERVIDRYEGDGDCEIPLRRPPPIRSWRFERHGDWDDERHDSRRPHREELFERWKKRNLIRITDLDNNKLVVGPNQDWPDSFEVVSFDMTTEHQRNYRVDVAIDLKHASILHILRIVISFQIGLKVMLMSGIAACLVTWIIVRPINRLRDHTQAIYSGELDTRTDAALRSRGDEIGALAQDFDRMAEYVEQTLNTHQKLMQDVSHELRAPLARLQAAAGLAEQRWGDDDKVVQRIIRECQRLDALIGEILSLSKLENSEAAGPPFALKKLLQEMIEDVRFSNAGRKVNLTVDCDCEVEGSRALLERALNNILGNACKHTEEDVAIDVMLTDEAGQCVINIRDHGTGVSESALEHLFEPFYRSTSKNNGYGLGLSIAQRAVQRLRGSIEARNHPEGGLDVTIRVPMAPR